MPPPPRPAAPTTASLPGPPAAAAPSHSWNEVQSQGWTDPSPVLPNRYAGAPYTPAQMATLAGAVASLMLGAGRGARLGTPPGQDPPMLWL